MRGSWLVIVMFIAVIFSISQDANAYTITFDDTRNYWPDWGNGEDDGRDTLTIPEFTGGSAEINDGFLTTLTFNQATVSHYLWPLISPGDLFLDTDGDTTWDYFVDLTNWTVSGVATDDSYYPAASTPPDGPYYNLYSINLPLGGSGGVRPPSIPSPQGYILSGIDRQGGWDPPGPGSYTIRDNHPVAYDLDRDVGNSTPEGTVGFSRWSGTAGSPSYEFDFTSDPGLNGGITLEGGLIIGWGVNCANDVVYERLPVPEPASLLLMGSGLIGLGLVGRRKFRNT